MPETFELAALHLPEELPLSLPSRLAEQRPDVRAAEEQLHAASAQYGVSIANLMPQFSISGAVGGMASTPGWMFRTGGGFFDLTANIAYNIFDGGTLRAQSRAAQQALELASAQYRSTVIVALQNVADTLHAIQSDAEALVAAARNEQAMSRVRELTRKQYDRLGRLSAHFLDTLQGLTTLKLLGQSRQQAQGLHQFKLQPPKNA